MNEVMTQDKWIEKARANADDLRSLIANYHPASHAKPDTSNLPITAPRAERMCDTIREEIRAEQAHKGRPVERFDKALDIGDVGEILSLLNDAWFGVPESTSCWGIEGFKEAVDLLDDPPREE